jgi:hypothetical protein
MTSNDKQIDVLMRRYAKAAPRTSVSDHLDADELSAFAEGSLPPATRAGYVSHLADCDDCRKQASALAISSGAVVRTEESPSTAIDGRSFWQVLAGLFALPVLRYAAFAAVLLIVAGVAFVVLRQSQQSRSDSPMIAKNEPVNQQSESAVKPPAEFREGSSGNKQANAETRSAPSPQLNAGNDQTAKADTATKPAEPPVSTGLMKEAPPAAPVTAEKKAGQGEVTQTAPSYAPAPPADVATQQKQEDYRKSQVGSGISGPRQQQQKLDTDKFGQERERDANKDVKDVVRTDDLARKSGAPASVAANQLPPSPRRSIDEKAKGPMRNMENNSINRNENVGRAEAPKTTSTGGSDKAATEEAQTRSAGGRKFRKQGAAWVDQKFKSSMTLKSVSRGSEAFDGLDSGLRSIAQQLGGDVIVVWKGKAYLIK